MNSPNGRTESKPRASSSDQTSCTLDAISPLPQANEAQQRRSKNNRDNGDSGQDSDHDRKRRKIEAIREDVQSRKRLKCPFFLRQPEKYTRGSCRGSGFTDMGKLKDHLKRVHTRPRQCPRCWKEFSSEEFRLVHLRDVVCSIEHEPQDDRISNELLQSLNFNKIPYANLPSVEMKWQHLYRELFPRDNITPSPYDDYALGPDFDKLLARNIAREFKKEFGPDFGADPALPLQEKLLEIIRQCREMALSTSPDSKEPPVPSLPEASSILLAEPQPTINPSRDEENA